MNYTSDASQRIAGFLFAFGLLGAVTLPSLAADTTADPALDARGVVQETVLDPAGRVLVRTLTPAPGLPEFPSANAPAYRGATDYLWLDTAHGAAIAADVAITGDGAFGCAGWWLNNKRTSLYAMSDDNVPEWERLMPAVEFQIRVDANRADRIATTGRADSLYVFDVGSNVPVASQWFEPGHVGQYSAISADGGTYAAVAGVPSGVGAIYVYDGVTGVLRFTGPLTGTLHGLTLSADGRFAAATTRTSVKIFDTTTGALRDSVAIAGETQIGSALSGDGRYLVTGGLARIVRAYEWNGTDYEQIWLDAIGGTTWATALAISDDGSTVAAGAWVNPSGGHVVLYDISSGIPLWVDTSYGDWISDLDLTPDGGLLVASSWGDLDTTEGNVVSVYERSSALPIHAIPDDAVFGVGSAESVAISDDGTKVIAGGKSVHARLLGDGGFVMAIDLLDPTAVETAGALGGSAWRVLPNPFVEGTRIEASRQLSSPHLDVVAVDGSLVRRLERNGLGDTTWSWDGRDDRGEQVPTGVYYIRSEADRLDEPMRIVRIR